MTKKSTKSALLTSSISLLLCFAMLLGTTFAWFTDSVTSANNIIQSGNLDVTFEYWNGTEWVNVSGKSDILTNTLWEPGVTEVAYLKVANEGTLALKYQMGINIVSETPGINVAGDLFKLSDHLKFGVVELDDFATYADRDVAVADVEDAKALNAGYYKNEDIAKNEPNQEHYFALVVWMPTTVGNEANHNGEDVPEIKLGLNVVATQLDAELDSFGPDYDASSTLPAVGIAKVEEGSGATTIEAGNVSVIIPEEAEPGEYQVVVTNKNANTNKDGQTTYTADINLLKDGVKVERNGDVAYLVEIEIGTDKSILKVLHNDREIETFDYNTETGILSFETDSFSPFTVIYEKAKIKVSSEAEFRSALNVVQSGDVIDATGVTLEPTGNLDTTVRIPAGVTVNGAKFASGSQCYLVVDGVGEDVKFESCKFDGPGFGMFVIAGEDQDGANMVFESCTFAGQIAPNFVQNSAGKSTFNNCTFTVGSDNIGLVNCMGGEHTFNSCTFDYTGGATFGSNQYVKWNAVNSYSERYSTKVTLVGCTFKNCSTQKFAANSGYSNSLTVK